MRRFIDHTHPPSSRNAKAHVRFAAEYDASMRPALSVSRPPKLRLMRRTCMSAHPYLLKPDTGIHRFTDEGAPPWNQPGIVELVNARAWRQFVILCDDVSSFIVTLAMMALEQGYDVYVVCHRINSDDTFSASRLEKAGATLLLFDRFFDECGYCADDGDE